MTARIVTVAQVRTRMQISSELAAPEVDEAITNAIDAAQLRIGTLIDSTLQSKDFEDVFYLDSDSFSGVQPAGLYRLRLRSGLLKPGSEAVYWGSDYNRCTIPVPVLDFHIDYVKGVVSIPRKKYNERFIRVTFNAGFEPIPEPTPQPDPSGDPSGDPPPTDSPPPTTDDGSGTGAGGTPPTGDQDTGLVGTTGDNAGGSPGVTLFGDSAYPYDRLISTSDTPLQSIAEPTPVPQTTDLAPDWLVEAVLGYVPAVMAAGLSQAEQSGTIKNYQASGQHALAVAAPYTRDSLGFCLRPVM